jgi:hypothetical protein
MPPTLLALSDLHVAYPENRKIIEDLRPQSEGDWLLLAGDVGELLPDIEWALRTLSERFATVVWTPGNHDLWTHHDDPVRLRGEKRYLFLVELCRSMGVITPEDPYPVWAGPGGPVTIAPVFLLYDYTFLPDGALNKAWPGRTKWALSAATRPCFTRIPIPAGRPGAGRESRRQNAGSPSGTRPCLSSS